MSLRIDNCEQLRRLYNAVSKSDGRAGMSSRDCNNLQKARQKCNDDTECVIRHLDELGRRNRPKVTPKATRKVTPSGSSGKIWE